MHQYSAVLYIINLLFFCDDILQTSFLHGFSLNITDKLVICDVSVCFSWTVILVAHFLQSVTSGLVLGGELVYHRGRAEEGGILTLAGQYSSEILFLLYL